MHIFLTSVCLQGGQEHSCYTPQGYAEGRKSGEWKLCATEKGYVTSETFLDILQDLVMKLEVDNIPRPVVVFFDGASPHISLAMAEYCKSQEIQPWLLKPNSTHLLQPLDLTFFKVLKTNLKQLCLAWQQDLRHIGYYLTKYTVAPILREAAEEVLEKSPGAISGLGSTPGTVQRRTNLR